MIYEIPYPPKELMPNKKNGSHWAKTKKIKDLAFNEAFTITKSKMKDFPISLNKQDKYKLTLTYYQSDKRHRDLDNLLASSKSQIDGIANALDIDDRQFQPITINRAYADKSYLQIQIF
jgi:crossover junction endodeoxyribonuclease RusA